MVIWVCECVCVCLCVSVCEFVSVCVLVCVRCVRELKLSEGCDRDGGQR